MRERIAAYAILSLLATITIFVGHEFAHCASAGHLADCHITVHLDKHPLHANHYTPSDHTWLNPLTVVAAAAACIGIGRATFGGSAGSC